MQKESHDILCPIQEGLPFRQVLDLDQLITEGDVPFHLKH